MKPRTSHGQRTLPAEHFTSPDIWRMEQERIFQRSWLLAGHVSELAQPGRYFLLEIGNESVIVLRDVAGKVRAHHNFCRHRGTRLCSTTRGQLGSTISCPYHAWTYELDGALRAAPNMHEVIGFDLMAWGLKPAALTERHGLLLVNLTADSPPFADPLTPLDARLAHWPLAELRSAHRAVYDIEANWKLLFHNFSECYHCPTVHPHLNLLTPYRNTENDLEEGPVLGGPMLLENPDGSLSADGRRCAPAFSGLTTEERGRVYYYTIFPSAFLSLHPDYVLVHRLEPRAFDRTRITCDWYFHAKAMATPGFDPSSAIAFWDLTNRQDWALCENAFRGMRSSSWEPGPYSELESQLAAFDRHYLGLLRGGAHP